VGVFCVLTNFSCQEATSVFVVCGSQKCSERTLTENWRRGAKKIFSRWSSPFFQSPPPIKNNAVAAFSPVYILYKRNSNTNTRTHTRAARREKKKKKEKEKVRSLLFYPLGDGTIESKSRREKEEVKKGGRERERELRELYTRIYIKKR